MTTRINVDAHAGWDVRVVVRERFNSYDGNLPPLYFRDTEHIVPKHTARDFYVHSHMEIVTIAEVKPE